MYKENKIEEFLNVLSSTNSMPGGGTASALVAANAVSLALKVCNLSIGKEKYKENEPYIKECIEKLNKYKETFLSLMDKDATEFKVMEDIYKMPKNTDEEKEKRKIALENACKICCKVPRELIENAVAALDISYSLYNKSNKSAESDLVTCNIFLRSAIEGAWQNVLINLKYISDIKFIEEYDKFGKSVLPKIY